MRTVQRAPVSGLVLVVALLTAVQATVGLGAVGWVVGIGTGTAAAVLLALALHRTRTTRFGPANVVTLVRAALGQAVAALVAASSVGTDHRTLLVGLAAVALALDAVDGQVARRTRSATALGARFDMEADAFLILVLSVAAGSGRRLVGAGHRPGPVRVAPVRAGLALAAGRGSAALLAQGGRGGPGSDAHGRRLRVAADRRGDGPDVPRPCSCSPSRSAATWCG